MTSLPLVRPFAGLRPALEYAEQVAAPPYDVLSTAEARERAKGNPWSFLHISKAEIDLPPETDPHSLAVYARAADNLREMIAKGVLVRDAMPCYYVYRIRMGTHVQTGIVAAASVEAYAENRIRRHEFTRPDKEDDRVQQIEACHAQTGPVLLAYRSRADVARVLERVTAEQPAYEITTPEKVTHTLWVVHQEDRVTALTRLFRYEEVLYICDGHHRSAAAARVALMRRAANPGHTDEEPYNSFLSVMFPADEMRIFDYNRVVKDLNGMTVETFLTQIGGRFTVEEVDAPVRPRRPHEFGMYLDGRWYRLGLKQDLPPASQPVSRLDVSLLNDRLLEPVLRIADPRRDQRIDFVGGVRGLSELQRRVDSGEMAVAFSLFPTSMEELMAVADAEEVMPPKSTWFEPKLEDGLVSNPLDWPI